MNEILPSGQVVHLVDFSASPSKSGNGAGTSAKEETSGEAETNQTRSRTHVEQPSPASKVQNNGALESSMKGNVSVSHEETARPSVGEAPAPHDLYAQNGQPDQKAALTVANEDPIARHFRDLLPHEKAALAHVPSPSQMKKGGGEAEPSPGRTRQQYNLRRTGEGWVECDKEEAEEKDEVAVKSIDHKETKYLSSSLGSDIPEATSSTKSDAVGGSTQSQWQEYAHREEAAAVEEGLSSSQPSSTSPVTDNDKLKLRSYFDEETVDAIIALYLRVLDSSRRTGTNFGEVRSPIIDRQLRTRIHQEIRSIFQSRLESTTDNDGSMIISAMQSAERGNTSNVKGRNNRNGERPKTHVNSRVPKSKLDWQTLGGEYLHFTLYKENKDTMECISWLVKQLNIGPKSFDFAGTKDRRAVTAQRVSVYRVTKERMTGAGRSLRNARVGDYHYERSSLQLGELTGNEFTITLRDCNFLPETSSEVERRATTIVQKAVDDLVRKGFINYYGLQRFGTYSIGTEEVGIQMLQGDFAAAVKSILSYKKVLLETTTDSEQDNDRVASEDRSRAKAIHLFETTKNHHRALDLLPRKFSAEATIIRHLSKPNHHQDYRGALQILPRNLRLMYVHAYQSLVWNMVASQRWKFHGSSVTEGDLILVNEHDLMENVTAPKHKVDEVGEAIVETSPNDRANRPEDLFVRARSLSKEEAESGKFTVFDIVLPLPGFDIIYPVNKIGDYYKEFMASERGGGLDPSDMRRSWKDISLSGSYRKFLAKPGSDISFQVKTYTDENEQLVETDLDRLNTSKKGASSDIANFKPEREQPVSFVETPMPKPVTEEALPPKPLNADVDNDPDADGGVRLDLKRSASNDKIAVILKLQLGSSQYATMALRELMKHGGIQTYKPDFSSSR